MQQVGARPVGPPIGNELACRRSRVVHGEDPHAPPGVRIFPLQNEPECDEGGVAHPSPVGVWPNQLVAYGEPVRAVTESMQLGELGDVQEGQSSAAMAHDDSPRVPTTNIALRRDAWRLSGQSSAPTKRRLHRRPRCPTDDLREWRDPRRTRVSLSLAKRERWNAITPASPARTCIRIRASSLTRPATTS